MILPRYTGRKYNDHDVQVRHVTLDKKSRAPAVHFNRKEYLGPVSEKQSILTLSPARY